MRKRNLREKNFSSYKKRNFHMNNTTINYNLSNSSKNIRNLEQQNSEIFDIPNQVPLIQSITIKPKAVSRELYEIILPGLNIKYDIICKNHNSLTNILNPYNLLTINTSDSVEILRIQITNFLIYPLVMRKIFVTDKNEYISNSQTDSTHNNMPFSSFYNSKQIDYVSENSNQAGISLLFFVDIPILKTNYNTECNISPNIKEKNEVNFTIKKIQEASSKIEGYFVLKISDEYNNIYKTENIPTDNSLFDYLNKIPYLFTKVQILNASVKLELINYYIRIDLKVIF